jgi:iron complex transport system ATP-binding protein
MQQGQSKILETKALTIGYGKHVLFTNLNLSLYKGQLVCFMGPNGSGKSSLIRTLGYLQKPQTGNVEIIPNNDDSFKNIAMVLTDSVRSGNMTVRDLITFGRYPYLHWNMKLQEEDVAAVEKAVTLVNLADIQHRSLKELSDGQLQMAMIARALAQDTPIILLDEPTSHLDLNNRLEVMKLMKRLSRDVGKAVLMATHELDLALQTADLIWLTGLEKNILIGTPEELVIGGVFDQIFAFKGFDLKTGKVEHEVTQRLNFEVQGDGYLLLWTRNALERNGYAVVDKEGDFIIRVKSRGSAGTWDVNSLSFETVSELIDYVQTL